MARRTRRPLFVRPRVSQLEDRSTPANLFVDPTFAGANLTFNTVPNGPGSAESQQQPLVLGTNAFTTIAEAVDKANALAGSDKVFLSTGTHDVDPLAASVEATETLQIVGQGTAGSTVRVITDTFAKSGIDGAVFLTQGPQFDLKGFTFDGQATAGKTVGSAIRFQGGTGSVDSVRATNIRADIGGQNFGFGVVAFGPGADVDVTGSKFDDLGRTGVSFFDRATGSVSASTFAGRAGVYNYGVTIEEGSTALVTGSTFAGFDFFDATGSSAGVSIADLLDQNFTGVGAPDAQPAQGTLIGNSFGENGSAGVVIGSGVNVDIGGTPRTDSSSAVAQHNNFQSTSPNSFSILTDTAATINALFNYYGSAAGPLAQAGNVSGGNAGGSLSNEVGDQVGYRDVAITPNAGVLVAPTPVLVAASGEAYRALLPLVSVTITPPGGPVTDKQPTFTATYTDAVFGVEAADFNKTGPGTPVVGAPAGAGTDYTVQLTGLTGSGTASLTAPASGLQAVTTALFGAVNLPTVRTASFAGTAASNTASIGFDAAAPAVNLFVDPSFAAAPLTFTTIPNGPGSKEAGQVTLTLGTNAFTTIAEALEAANATTAADAIFLSTGTHDVDPFAAGGLEVQAAVRVEGQGIADTAVQVTDDTTAGSGVGGAVFYTKGPQFDLKGFTFDGRADEVNPATAEKFFVGSAFRYQGGTGSVDSVRVTAVQADVGGQNFGFGVVAFGPGADVDVTNSTFDALGRTGVSFFDRATGSVATSTFAGRAGVFSYGVTIEEGSSALVTASTFAGYDFFDATGSSAGVSIADLLDQNFTGVGAPDDQPATGTLIGNAFGENASAGVLVGSGVGVDVGGTPRTDSSSAVVQHNNFASTAASSFSILTDTDALVNALFNFYGGATGPLAQGTNVSGPNAGGSLSNEVGDQVVYTDPAITPNGGVLTTATPVLAAASGEAYRALLPLVTATAAPLGATTTNQQPTFGLTYSAPVFGLAANDVAASGPGAPVVGAPAGAGTDFTVAVTGLTGVGPAKLAAPASGLEAVQTTLVGTVNIPSVRSGLFAGTAASNEATVLFDDVAPTLQVTSAVVDASTTKNNPVVVTLQFNEAIDPATFDKTDVVLGGTATGTVQSVTTVNNQTFTVTIGGLAGAGTITVAAAAGAASDAAGNASAPLAATLVANADTVLPVITITPPADAGTARPPASTDVTITFTKPVTGFDKTDIAVAGGTGAAVANLVASADNKTFTATINGATTGGTVTLTVADKAATDAAGNFSGPAGPVTVATFNTTSPSITITSPVATVSTTQSNPLAVTVAFSEAVTDFDASDVDVGGTATGAVTGVTSADNKTFTVTIGGLAGAGTITVGVPAGAAKSAAGVLSLALPETLVANADLVLPVVSAAGVLQDDGSVVVTITSTKPLTGLTGDDLTLGGTAAGGSVQAFTASADNKTFTATVGGFTQNGSLSVALPAGAAADAVGNPNAALAPSDVAAVIAPAPTAAFTVPPGLQTGVFETTLTFSQAVSGLTAADVALAGTAAGATVQSITPSADNKSFTVRVGGFTSRGNVTVSVPAGAGTNANGTATPAAASETVSVTPVFNRGFAIGTSSGATIPFITVDEAFAKGGGTVSGTVARTQGVRVATADVNGDGTLDIIVGSSPGRASEVVVYSGVDKTTVLFRVSPFESSFTGGVFVAGGDINGDGKADVVITPDESGGPRVDVYSGATGNAKLASFFGIDDDNFRGGARAAVGDVNGDGFGDIVVSAGFSGGPRIAGFDGKSAATGTRLKIFADFFAFEETLRNGAYVAVGDLNADGKADLIFGGGPGGGPRVRALSGAALIANNTQTQISNFFAGTDSNRGGVRVAAKDIDGDGRVDIVTGDGASGSTQARVYLGARAVGLTAGSPTADQTIETGAGFVDGIYVG